MLVFVLNQTQKANTGKIRTPVYENVREFGVETVNPRMALSFGDFSFSAEPTFFLGACVRKCLCYSKKAFQRIVRARRLTGK